MKKIKSTGYFDIPVKRYGHETCIIYALNDIEVKKLLLEKCDIEIITPIVNDFYFEILYKKIEYISHIKKITVIFNDWGLLYRCRELIAYGRINVILGRCISHCLENWIWKDIILHNEDKENQYRLEKNVWGYSERIKLLKEFEVQQIEINKDIKPNYSDVRFVNREDILLGISNICLYTKITKTNIDENCKNRACLNLVELTKLKDWTRGIYTEMEKEDIILKIYVKGNGIYKR